MKPRKEREYVKLDLYRYNSIVDRMEKELFITRCTLDWGREPTKRGFRNYRVIHRNLDCKSRINKNKSLRIRS